jgi:hypothetical protein
MSYDVCELSGKNCYPSERAAKKYRNINERVRNRKFRVYRCRHCHSYHLTSVPYFK